jgi:hypothetical protein
MTCEENWKYGLSRPGDLICKVNHAELLLVGVEPMQLSNCSNSDFVINIENITLSSHKVVSSELQDLNCISDADDSLLDNA